MSRTRVKFCGIRRRQDAEAAVALGVDALGFVMVPGSPRFIDATAAARIRERIPPFVSVVALFKDADVQTVQDAIDALKPDLLQFHGAETADFCDSFGHAYVKALGMGTTAADAKASARAAPGTLLARAARAYSGARALLLDGHAPGAMGGSGHRFDWKAQQAAASRLKKPLILAGGLDADTVAAGIRALRPYAVDVSSGIESRPGIKDPARMRAFLQAVRRADEKRK